MSSKFLKDTGKRLIKIIDGKDGIQLVFNVWHQREELLCITDELTIARKYLDLGWVKKRVLSEIILLAPDIQLVDLTNPLKSNYFEGEKNCFKKLLALFLATKELCKNGKLKKIIKRLYRGKFFILNGEAIDLETRIAFYDNHDGSLKNKIIKKIEDTDIYKKNLQDLIEEFGEKERRLSLYKKPIVNLLKFKKIIDLYIATVDKDFTLPENVYGFGKLLPASDYYLLIPHSGLKFIDEISKRVGLEKILIYEKHFSKDGDFWVFKKDIKNKKVFIFDISYSGKTMDWVRDVVKEQGGKPFKIAVWPKSSIALGGVLYVMFLDRRIEKSKINLRDKNWAINLYKQIAFNK